MQQDGLYSNLKMLKRPGFFLLCEDYTNKHVHLKLYIQTLCTNRKISVILIFNRRNYISKHQLCASWKFSSVGFQ